MVSFARLSKRFSTIAAAKNIKVRLIYSPPIIKVYEHHQNFNLALHRNHMSFENELLHRCIRGIFS